jgi:carbonic anhydrase
VANRWGGPVRYNGVQFHFHTGSEHTIDGVRYDLEMHTVHLPLSKDTREPGEAFNYAAVGVIFSVGNYTATDLEDYDIKIIDDFFDSLMWNITEVNPKVPKVPYGDLMTMVNTNHRWVYKGSVTTPPCATLVYWNVLRTVYPIKEHHFKLFQDQMNRGKGNLAKTGNWREIQ